MENKEPFSPYSSMSLIERLSEAGLSKEFDKAAFADDEIKLRELLTRVDLDADSIEKTLEWIRSSPYSPFNKHPVRLSPELKADSRLSSVDQGSARIIQHLFDSHGGTGDKSCVWKDCGRPALKGSAFCA